MRQKSKKVIYLPKAQDKANKKKRLPLLLLVFAFLYFSVLFVGQYWRLVQLRHSLETIQAEIETVKIQNEAMSREIERLHSPSYIEQVAREDLGMVRSGELLFFLQEKDKPSVTEQE
ncbi:MAG: septum formation initiator family protein [Firmicutes bacterium]|nr:septum formation initiator family protein [Bacillota bacterium]